MDDALISVQFARNVASGAGYRFDPTGPSTDGVTPLPWPWLLSPFAHADAWTVLCRAQWLGIAFWTLAAGLLGAAIAKVEVHGLPLVLTTPQRSRGRAVRFAALLLVLASLPVSAHAASGMETGVVIALCTASVALHEQGYLSTSLGALAAAFRPELAPWALAWAMGRAIASGESRRRIALLSAASLVPFVAIAITRAAVFGHPYPLALLAKPSDMEHGSTYAIAGLIASVVPLACMAPIALSKGHPIGRAIAVAFVVHVVVVVLVGGDWMPYARLFAPVIPGLALAYVHAGAASKLGPLVTRTALALAIGGYFWVIVAPKGFNVMSDRARLVADARPVLADCTRVATVDIGWVSVATQSSLVDLAGLTDPMIAALPGGHTSKRVDVAMLLDREVDCAVFYVDPGLRDASLAHPETISFAHAVSERLAHNPLFEAHFRPLAKVTLGDSDRGYVVFVTR